MIRKLMFGTLLAATTLGPAYVIISIEPEVVIIHQDFTKYELPLGTNKKEIDQLLGKPHNENGMLYYYPRHNEKLIGFYYYLEFDENNRLINQTLGVGCTPNSFSVRDYSHKEKLLNFIGFKQHPPLQSLHLMRAKYVLKELGRFLESKNYYSDFKVDAHEEKL